MSEDFGAPSGSAASTPGSAADTNTASADTGNALGVGDDAAAGHGEAQQDSAPQSGGFLFNGRLYRDQAHAEQAYKAQVGRVPEVQRQNAEYQRQVTQYEYELQALRQAVASQGYQGQEQGGQQGGQDAQSFAKELANSGELEFIASLAETQGVGHAMYAMAEAMEKRMQTQLQQFEAEKVMPFQMQQEVQQGTQRLLNNVKPMLSEFPELEADADLVPEAAEAQEFVLNAVRGFPPEWLVEHPEAIRMAALEYRHLHGIPTFSQPPGSSGSPSAYSMAAHEGSGTPLDGSGVPRPGGRGRESVMDRMRRENRQSSPMVKSDSGRVLFSRD